MSLKIRLGVPEVEAFWNEMNCKFDSGELGPNKDEITILGIEPHLEDKVKAYRRINLSSLPEN